MQKCVRLGKSILKDDDVVLRHTFPVFHGARTVPNCYIVGTFVGAVSIFGPDALPVVHQ